MNSIEFDTISESDESVSVAYKPVNNWKEDKAEVKPFFDDGTQTYFWRAHTLTALFCVVGILIYEAIFSDVSEDAVDNTKRGMVAMCAGFILLGIAITPDGPFIRPHPIIWKFFLVCSMVYELILLFIVFQSLNGAHQLLKYLDYNLGEPQQEKDYAGSCVLYDYDRPENPYHNIMDKMDLFVPLHFFGWWMKALVLRDSWLCWVTSIMFEMLEYTLEHQLPNFSECWWDHWIMDALVCNGLGIWAGMKTISYFRMKKYYWRGLWNIPSYRGKLRRIVAQFGPYIWVDYDWKPFSSIGRWCSTLVVIALFLLTELNTFYLKFVLRIPPDHWLNLLRVCFILPCGAVAIREVFQYFDDPDCKKIGRQALMLLAIIFTELLVVLKFGWKTVTIPIPRHVLYLWLLLATAVLIWSLWKFLINPHTLKMKSQDAEKRRDHWAHVRAIETKPDNQERNFFTQFVSKTFNFSNATNVESKKQF